MSVVKPMYGITVQKYEDRNDFWYLRLFYVDGLPTFSKSLSIGEDADKSLKEIKKIRDELVEEALIAGHFNFSSPGIRPSIRNKSGINGVQLYFDTTKSPRFAFTAYANINGKILSKTVAVKKWGWKRAFKNCIKWRRIQDLKKVGWSTIPPVHELNMDELLDKCLYNYRHKYPQILTFREK